MSKINPINPGMAHLLQAANNHTPEIKAKSNVVTRIYVVLEGKYFFVHGNCEETFKIPQSPPFPVCLDEAYSEIYDPNPAAGPLKKVIGVEKHTHLMLFACAMRVDEVSPPSWWDKREQGAL